MCAGLPIPQLKGLVPPEQKKPQQQQEQSRLMTPPPTTTHSDETEHRNSGQHSRSASELPKSPTSDKPTFVARQQSTPISTTPVRTRNAVALFSSSVDDPWGAPQATNSHSQQPPVSAPPQVDHFPTTDGTQDRRVEEEIEEHEPDDIHAALRNTNATRTATSTWGNNDFGAQQGYGGENYSQSIIGGGFGEHSSLGTRHGSFGGLGGNRLNGGAGAGGGAGGDDHGRNGTVASGLERIKAAMKAPEENVTVNVLPEKEGMFMFQHRNYQICSTRRGSRVVRRYSDFVW